MNQQKQDSDALQKVQKTETDLKGEKTTVLVGIAAKLPSRIRKCNNSTTPNIPQPTSCNNLMLS
jgi:hypothetical protein